MLAGEEVSQRVSEYDETSVDASARKSAAPDAGGAVDTAAPAQPEEEVDPARSCGPICGRCPAIGTSCTPTRV